MSKAGGAGSTPDSTTKHNWKQQPLSALLSDIGESVASLNTVVVGLDAVEKGHEKPEGLDISWSPKDRRAAARKARKFVVEAVLVRVFESIFAHMNLVASLPRFADKKQGWDDKGRAQKIWDVYRDLLGETYLLSAVVLICHWRNRIVHPGSNAKLNNHQKSLLQGNEEEIAREYKGLSVDCLLCHFEEGRPTLKDVSVLIAMAIRLARLVDEKLSCQLTKEDFDAWVHYFDLKAAIAKVEAETKPEKVHSSVKRVFQAKAPMLLEGYEEFYPRPVS